MTVAQFPVADPDLELGEGERGEIFLLALPAFVTSAI